MIHMLFNMCQRLIQDILNKFIIHENIMKTTKSKQALLPAAELCELDLEDVVIQRAQCEFGAHVKSLLNKFDAHSRRKIEKVLIKFYIACSDYLIENLPIDGQVVADARPLSQKFPNAHKGISRLASAVVNCLGEEKAREVFKQKSETSAYDIIDKIKYQFTEYQTEVIPTSLRRMKYQPPIKCLDHHIGKKHMGLLVWKLKNMKSRNSSE